MTTDQFAFKSIHCTKKKNQSADESINRNNNKTQTEKKDFFKRKKVLESSRKKETFHGRQQISTLQVCDVFTLHHQSYTVFWDVGRSIV